MAQPIPSTLGDAQRDTTAAALQASLVDLIDLSLVAKQAHWNLVGRQFHDVHLHLDELVDDRPRVLGQGGRADGRDRRVRRTGAPERWTRPPRFPTSPRAGSPTGT